MNYVKRTILIFALMLTIVLSSAFLFSCGKVEDVKVSITGSGQVLTEKTKGNKFLIATAEDWYSFIGWYNGNRRYSDNSRLKITKNTPKNLEARFATTARLSFDRILNGFYNAYKIGLNQEGEYFNIKAETSISSFKEDNLIEKEILFGGHLNTSGKGNQLFFKGDDEDDFSFVYDDSFENGFFFLNKNGEKIVFDEIGLLSDVLKSFKVPSEQGWSIEKFLNNETAFYQFEQYFGYINATGIIESVINTKNASSLVINFQKLLSTLKNNYPNFENGSLLQKIVDILTGNYQEKSFPKIMIKLDIEYEGEENQTIKTFNFEFETSNDYILKFGERNFTIQKGNTSIKFKSIEYGFCNSPFNFDGDLSSFPKPKRNLLNVHLAGDLSFVKKEAETENVEDIYRVELNADLNPFAMLSFKNSSDYNKINWNNLGFLNFRIILIPSTNDEELQNQYDRHKGSTDYLNILIDTDRFGANMFVYAAFYDPSTLLTTSYFVNNSFNIPELLNYYNNNGNENLNLTANQKEKQSPINISNILKCLIDIILSFDEDNINASIYNMIIKYCDYDNIIKDNLTIEEDGLVLKTQNIREFIREKEIQKNLIVNDFYPIKLDKYIFGDESIYKLILNFDKFSYGNVVKKEGDYLDENGLSLVEYFIKNHKTVLKINTISYFDDKILSNEDIYSLTGQTVEADELTLLNGEISSTYYSTAGKNEKLKLKILDSLILSKQNNAAKVRFILAVDAPFNRTNLLNTTISEVLLKNLNIPYGLMVFEAEIKTK